MTTREDDQFDRLRIVHQIERDRALVAQYEKHMAFYRARIEERMYDLGKLDERLAEGDDR